LHFSIWGMGDKIQRQGAVRCPGKPKEAGLLHPLVRFGK
jgi:hypothetical protein